MKITAVAAFATFLVVNQISGALSEQLHVKWNDLPTKTSYKAQKWEGGSKQETKVWSQNDPIGNVGV